MFWTKSLQKELQSALAVMQDDIHKLNIALNCLKGEHDWQKVTGYGARASAPATHICVHCYAEAKIIKSRQEVEIIKKPTNSAEE